MSDTTRALVEQAAAKLGVSPLARRLNVPDAVVVAWITGHAPIPSRTLVLLVELLEKPKE
jgi:hypothetical protein